MTDITDQKTNGTDVNSVIKNGGTVSEEITVSQNDSQDINTSNINEGDIVDEGAISTTSTIKITVQGSDGTEIGSFIAKKGETIMALAQSNNVEIPFSCGAGACGLCLCYIVQGGEYINKEYTTPSFMQLDEDQVLTCIAAVKDECFDNENANIEIVLKRAY